MQPTMMTYIEQEAATFRQVLQQYQTKLAPLFNFAQQQPIRRCLILATGSSYNAALCAKLLFEQDAEVLVEIKEPYNFTHYEQFDPQTDLVLVISQSGKSSSTIAALQKVAKQGLTTFCLTANLNSPISQAATHTLDINCGEEKVGFVTKGFSATVLNLLLIALQIAKIKQSLSEQQIAAKLQQLQSIVDVLPNVISQSLQFFAQHRATFTQHQRFIAIAYGANIGVAKEFETKFTETVRQPSTGFELEAYMHGPYLEAKRDHLLFFIQDQPQTRMQQLQSYLQPYVAKTFTLTANDHHDAATILNLNLPLEHALSPLLLVIPIQILAYQIATARGIDLNQRIFDDFDQVLKSKI